MQNDTHKKNCDRHCHIALISFSHPLPIHLLANLAKPVNSNTDIMDLHINTPTCKFSVVIQMEIEGNVKSQTDITATECVFR